MDDDSLSLWKGLIATLEALPGELRTERNDALRLTLMALGSAMRLKTAIDPLQPPRPPPMVMEMMGVLETWGKEGGQGFGPSTFHLTFKVGPVYGSAAMGSAIDQLSLLHKTQREAMISFPKEGD